jgi:hypothetical protein
VLGEVIDAAIATQEHDLADRAVGERRPESLVHQLDEARPWRRPDVEFKLVVPQLGIVGEVGGRICDAPVLRGAPHAEVALTPIQPWEGIAHAIVPRELHFVRGGKPLVVLLVISLAVAAIQRTTVVLVVQGALYTKEANVHELLLLVLLHVCCFNSGHLIAQRDQWWHHVFDRLEPTGDVCHGELLLRLLGCNPRPTSHRIGQTHGVNSGSGT